MCRVDHVYLSHKPIARVVTAFDLSSRSFLGPTFFQCDYDGLLGSILFILLYLALEGVHEVVIHCLKTAPLEIVVCFYLVCIVTELGKLIDELVKAWRISNVVKLHLDSS